MANDLNHSASQLTAPETEMREMLERKRRSIPEPYVSSTRRSAIPSQTLRNPILRNEIQNPAIAEADAYRPCRIATSDTSATNIRSPLAEKSLRQYQLKPENAYTAREFKYNNTGIAISSSLPRMSKTALPSSKALRKTLSGDFRQNSQNASSDDNSMKSKCESEISMKKFLHGINNLNSPSKTMTCVARPVYCDNEISRARCDTIPPLQKAAIIHQTTEMSKNLSPANMTSDSPLALSNTRNSTVDIKWEVSKCNIKRESKCQSGIIGNPTKPVLKVIRARRLTVACSAINDWPDNVEGTTLERNAPTRKNIIGSDSWKCKTTRELPKKPWFSSSVDGPPIASQVRETAIDDDLPCKRLIAPRFHASNSASSVPVQKPTIVKSGSSHAFRMSATPPPKPTRTYEEVPVDLMRTERPVHRSKSDIKSVRKTCPIMGSSRMIVPKDYRNSRDHSSDSGFGADFRKSSSDTIESSPEVQTSGKWLQALDLPCDSCYSADEDLMSSDNSLISRRNSLVVRTQTGLRVKTIIDKLLNSNGRDQRRALFSLKQIFQDDKDLVHEFVQNGGLECMIKLGRQADQNHQNYILRVHVRIIAALGQVMLYVDGMNGIIAHIETIQWLYELLDSPASFLFLL
uniref:Formin_GBD_N domain-containing protein n=1 Tax=Elaeophora elaphi TaxID=1147741 RepID=A0A0R3RJK3_9BILA